MLYDIFYLENVAYCLMYDEHFSWVNTYTLYITRLIEKSFKKVYTVSLFHHIQ